MHDSVTIKLSKRNKDVYTFLRWPSYELEPIGKEVLQIVCENSPVLRFKVCEQIAKRVQSRQTPSQVVAYWQNRLRKLDLIKVQKFEDWEKEQQALQECAQADVQILAEDTLNQQKVEFI